MKELGIYIHIPFCKHKCDYCDFISFENKDEEIEKYIEKLEEEINSAEISFLEYKVSTIYIGGGTPSYIDSKYIARILNTIEKKFDIFNLKESNIEKTIEINPGVIDKEKLKHYYNLGINRISIGMQSSDNNILKTIGRIHTYEDFLQSYNMVREIGFKNVNIDMIIGLPNQDVLNVKNTLKELINLNPEHVSVYSLILEEGTKLKKQIDSKIISLPKEEVERKMYWTAKKMLEKAGYIHYEISNFAKEGYSSKHNLDCWRQEEYIGFGINSSSYINDTRYSNTDNMIEYLKFSTSCKSIDEVQKEESKMKEYILLGLRKIEGISISEFKNKFIDNPIYLYREILNKLVLQGLIIIDDNHIKLTKKGIDLANLVWEEFI